ncbi:MAG: T9SS type A sorting domain-containing protein [Bacteroidales bacterium]|nr:T9SS type A sorting domain-containing protein [Bacteroidales bacterium]MCF8455030.1 T9SS type A sorting domain-containing protein [Bacteroidales bacterium]
MKTKHMSLYVITLLVFTFAINSSAQSYFPRTYYLDDTALVANSMEKSFGGGYIIGGYTFVYNTNYSTRPFYCKIDSLGNMVWSRIIDQQGGFSSIISTYDSCFVLAGNLHNDSVLKDNFFCLKISDDGDKVWSSEIDLGGYESVNHIQQTYDKGFILAGYSCYPPYYYGYTNSAYAKLDSLGNPIWCKRDSVISHRTEPRSITETNDSGFVAVGSTYKPQGSNSTRQYITKLNSDGTTDWFKGQNVSDGYYSVADDVIASDTGFTIYAKTEAPNNSLSLISLDLSGNISQVIGWQPNNYYWGLSNYPLRLKKRNNGELIMVSPGGIYWFDNNSDSLLGHYYFFDAVFDCDNLSNEEFLVFGSGPVQGSKDLLNPQFGIINTDSLGVSGDCDYWGPTPYPIPFDTIEIDLSNMAVIQSNYFEIRIQSFQIIDLPIQNYNGCVGFVGDVYKEVDNASHFNLYPNPSTGIFQIQFTDVSNIALFSVSVYNLVGQKIVSLPSGIHDRVDLQSQPDGLYLIRIMMDGKDSCQRIIKRSN